MEIDRIKVILVDDEPLEIKLIKKCIDWKSLNMEVVGEAQNAIDGMDLVKNLSPDILFTDINMPIINGIKFSEMAIQERPKIKIIILTGFDDFDYAQESIKIGVSAFLLKPINDDEVFSTLSRLKEGIDNERKSIDEYDLLKRQLSDNLPFLREKYLIELLNGELDIEKAKKKTSFLGLYFKYNSFQIAAIEINSSVLDNENLNAGKYLLKNIKIMNTIKESFQKNKYIYVFYDTLNRIIILNNDENTDLFEECENLKTEIINNDHSINIGLGGIKKQLTEISTSYKEALEALKYRVAVGNNAVILYDRLNICDSNNKYNINELNEKMSFYLKSGLNDKAISQIRKYFENMNMKSENALKEIRMVAMNIISLSFKILIDMNEYDDVYRLQAGSFAAISSINNLPDLEKYLEDTVLEIINIINDKQVSKINDTVIQAKEYIDNNLSDCELSLSRVAKHLYLNPSYLSRMFKKEIGISFVEYLTKIRMEKAVELIRGKDLKAFQIAQKVGIADSNYFCTCFKKYAGMSVSEYKRFIENKKVE